MQHPPGNWRFCHNDLGRGGCLCDCAAELSTSTAADKRRRTARRIGSPALPVHSTAAAACLRDPAPVSPAPPPPLSPRACAQRAMKLMASRATLLAALALALVAYTVSCRPPPHRRRYACFRCAAHQAPRLPAPPAGRCREPRQPAHGRNPRRRPGRLAPQEHGRWRRQARGPRLPLAQRLVCSRLRGRPAAAPRLPPRVQPMQLRPAPVPPHPAAPAAAHHLWPGAVQRREWRPLWNSLVRAR